MIKINHDSNASFTKCTINNGLWQTYVDPFYMKENGTVSACVYDEVGNVSDISKLDRGNIDINPPTAPTIVADITDATNKDVTVTICNGSDVAVCKYSLDGEKWKTHRDPILVNTNCTVYAYTADDVGNTSDIVSLPIVAEQTIVTPGGGGSSASTSDSTSAAPTPTKSASPTPTPAVGADLVKEAVYALPDKPTNQDVKKDLEGLAGKALNPADSQKIVEEVLNKLQSIDAATISAATSLINNSSKIVVDGNIVSDKALDDVAAVLMNASKYIDSLKGRFGKQTADKFKEELALNIVISDKKGNSAEVLIGALGVKKLGNTGVGLKITTSALSASVPNDLLGSTALDNVKYFKFVSALVESKGSKALIDKAKGLDTELEEVGPVNRIELYTVDDKGNSAVITSLKKPIEVILTLSDLVTASIRDNLKIGVIA